MVLAALLPLAVAGCATRVVNTSSQLPFAQQASATLPRPQQILVLDFATDGTSLQLDQGVGPRLQRAFQGDSVSADQRRMRDEVQDAIADALVTSIRKMGLPAMRVSGVPRVDANVLVVRGQILRIDQGNRTRRLGIGFGAGKSEVAAKVQVSYERPGAPAQVVQTYDADSNSGRKPGLALGAASAAGGGSLAPLALSGVTGVAAEKYKSEVAKEGATLANHVAEDLGTFFAQQGWVPAAAAPAPPSR